MKYKDIGWQIRLARMEAGLTQAQLGKKIGVTWEMISRYERGASNPMQKIIDLSQALNRPLNYFLQENQSDTKKFQVSDSTYPVNVSNLFVPFFSSISEYKIWQKNKIYSATYIIPLWLTSYQEVFALDLSTVQSGLPKLHGEGVLFASADSENQKSDFVVLVSDDEFVIKKRGQLSSDDNVIASVLAREERLL